MNLKMPMWIPAIVIPVYVVAIVAVSTWKSGVSPQDLLTMPTEPTTQVVQPRPARPATPTHATVVAAR